jgi:hypothetical protein
MFICNSSWKILDEIGAYSVRQTLDQLERHNYRTAKWLPRPSYGVESSSMMRSHGEVLCHRHASWWPHQA